MPSTNFSTGFSPGQKRRPRRPRGPGSIAGWVRGWGLGGTPPGVDCQRPQPRPVPAPCKLFSRPGPAGRASATGPRPLRQIDRQVDMPPVRELDIARMNAQTTLATAAAFDDVAGPDREAAGQTIYMGTHDNPPGRRRPLMLASNARSRRRFRDNAAMRPESCESLCTTPKTKTCGGVFGRLFADGAPCFWAPTVQEDAPENSGVSMGPPARRGPEPPGQFLSAKAARASVGAGRELNRVARCGDGSATSLARPSAISKRIASQTRSSSHHL